MKSFFFGGWFIRGRIFFEEIMREGQHTFFPFQHSNMDGIVRKVKRRFVERMTVAKGLNNTSYNAPSNGTNYMRSVDMTALPPESYSNQHSLESANKRLRFQNTWNCVEMQHIPAATIQNGVSSEVNRCPPNNQSHSKSTEMKDLLRGTQEKMEFKNWKPKKKSSINKLRRLRRKLRLKERRRASEKAAKSNISLSISQMKSSNEIKSSTVSSRENGLSSSNPGESYIEEVVVDDQQDEPKSGPQSGPPTVDRYLALDCEFVGVGPKGRQSALGRCSIVDYHGQVVLDIYAKPNEVITDYRTPWSGLRKRDLVKAVPVNSAINQIKKTVKGKIIVGHAIHNDYKVLKLGHQESETRDICRYKPLRIMASYDGSSAVSLKKLSASLLNRKIQAREHCSLEDARATMDLFKLVRDDWEKELLSKCEGTSKRKEDLETEKSFLDDEYWKDDSDMIKYF